jgi:hypothetical protein
MTAADAQAYVADAVGGALALMVRADGTTHDVLIERRLVEAGHYAEAMRTSYTAAAAVDPLPLQSNTVDYALLGFTFAGRPVFGERRQLDLRWCEVIVRLPASDGQMTEAWAQLGKFIADLPAPRLVVDRRQTEDVHLDMQTGETYRRRILDALVVTTGGQRG